MKHGLPVFDGDGHVLENETEIEKYYEGDFVGSRRLEGMTIFPSLDGWSRSMIVKEGDEGRKHWHTDAALWGEMLEVIGCEGSVLYPTSALAYGIMQSIEFQTATCIAYNNWLEGEYTSKDDRLFGVGLIPFNDIDAGKKEIIRCAKSRKNFPAMLLPTVTGNARHFGDEYFWPLYEEAERQNIPITFHGAVSKGFGLDLLQPFVKVHTLEHPIPLMIQITDMMFSGVFETFPNLKFAFLEGGCSWVPFMMDRMDYEYDSVFGVASRKKLKKKPSQIFRDTDSIWVSCEMGEKSMKHVMDFYGTDRIIYASDFPHEPTEEDMTADVPDFLASNDFSQEEKGKVLYHNARNLYGLN